MNKIFLLKFGLLDLIFIKSKKILNFLISDQSRLNKINPNKLKPKNMFQRLLGDNFYKGKKIK